MGDLLGAFWLIRIRGIHHFGGASRTLTVRNEMAQNNRRSVRIRRTIYKAPHVASSRCLVLDPFCSERFSFLMHVQQRFLPTLSAVSLKFRHMALAGDIFLLLH